MQIVSAAAALCLAFTAVSALAQAPAAGSNWQRVQQLPVHTRVHVASDKRSRVCSIDSVTENRLVCSAGRLVSTSHYTFPRGEIKSIKITRYPLSTVAGAGIGGGAGLLTGVGIAHGSQGSLAIVSNSTVWGVAALGGALLGGAVGGPTDFLRGPTIYRRR